MLEQLGTVAFQDCHGKYVKLRAVVEAAAGDPVRQRRIYEMLHRLGGRCDCTVDRNVIRIPQVLAKAEEGIATILCE